MRRPVSLRRVLGIALRIAAGLVVLLVVLVAVVAYQAENLVHAAALAEAARFGERVGRRVTVGPAHVELGANLSVQLDQIRVEGAPDKQGPAAEPLFEIAAVRVRVSAWSIVRSFGKDVDVRAIDARGPVVRLVRLADGELSYADLVTRFATSEPPAEHPRRAVRLGPVHVTDGRVELYDLSRDVEHGGVHLTVDRLAVIIPEIRSDAPMDLLLDAAVIAPAQNLHLDLTLAPLTEAPAFVGRLRHVALRLAAVDVAPLLPFFPGRGGIRVASAAVSAELALTAEPHAPIVFLGSLSAVGLRLVRNAGTCTEAVGNPMDVTARADVTVDPEEPALVVRALSITAGGMTVEGNADVRGPLEAPEVRALEVHARDVTFERLLALAPPASLPAGVSLSGPIGLRATAHGPPRAAVIDVAADLGNTTITLPQLHKPAGVALAATLAGRAGREGGGLDVEALGIRLGPLALTLRGWVRSATDLDLTLDSGEVALDGLLRLLPEVARGVPAGTTLAGHVQASGHVTRTATETRGDARLALRSAAVKTPALTLEGAADLSATVRSGPGSLSVTADLDAAGARARVPGRFDKAAGSPLSLHAQVERAGAVTTVHEARVTLAGAAVAGTAHHDAASHRLTVDASRCELDLAALSRAFPALEALPAPLAGARGHATVSFSRDLRDPSTTSLHLGDLDVSAPFGHVQGSLDVHGSSPLQRVAFALRADALDIDTLAAGSPLLASRSPGSAPPPLPALDALDVHGKLHLGRLHARALDARDLDLDVALDHGLLSLPTLRFSAFGGAFTASGSRVDLAHGVPAFALRAGVEHLDLAALAAARATSATPAAPASEISGKLDATVSLDGAGLSWAAIAPHLAGTVQLSVDGVHVKGKRTVRGTIVNPLIGKLAERAKQKHPVREIDTTVTRATVALRVAGGVVSTTTPLSALTEEGTVTIEGTVGFDEKLSLLGSVVIPPAVIDKATKGLLVPYGDATVKVRIDGTTQSPRIELLDLEGTVKALRGSWLHGIARKVEHAFGKE
jgi:hypothetical protein